MVILELMKVLILGGSGRLGMWLLRSALRGGHAVHAIVRDTSRITIKDERLVLFPGNPTDKNVLLDALGDCDAVVSALNISRKTDFPWAPLRTPKTFLSDVMAQLLAAGDSTSLKKIVICSAWGVGESEREIPGWFRWFINNSNVGAAYQQHHEQEILLRDSPFNWTIVRPVGLTNSKKSMELKISYDNKPKPSLTISRKDVAKFMIDTLFDESFTRKMPVIST